MQKLTNPTRVSDIKRSWYKFDCNEQILGRVVSQIAQVLMGKNKPYFVRNLDCGNYVVVVNAKYIKVSGNKEKDKQYGNYSGFPGGLKTKSLWQIRSENPTEIIRHAVWGMLPKNKLRDRLMSRLYIYPGSDHPHREV